MNHYRLYFRALDTKVAQFRVELIEAESDRAACEQARQFLGEHTLELWLQERKVCTIDEDGCETLKPLYALYACIATGRSPTVGEMEAAVTRTLDEAFQGDLTPTTRDRAVTLTRAAFHGVRWAA